MLCCPVLFQARPIDALHCIGLVIISVKQCILQGKCGARSGSTQLQMSSTWSDPGEVSTDYHGGQYDSNETKSSCSHHKLLMGR